MTRTLAVALASVTTALVVVVTTAPSATTAPNASNAAGVQAQINALKRQTKTLQKQVKALQKQTKSDHSLLVATFAVAFCDAAMTADALQATWTTVNQFATGQGKPAPFPSTTATINDRNLCQALRITRQPAAPPTAAPFVALLALLGG